MKYLVPFSLLVCLTVLPAAGCGGTTTYTLVGTEASRATDGVVEIDSQGGNHHVTVTLEHLTPPERLGSGLTVFAVWFVRDGAAPVLAGSLDYDPDARSGTMIATTPYSEFVVLVTAEESMAVVSPGDVVVAEQQVEH